MSRPHPHRVRGVAPGQRRQEPRRVRHCAAWADLRRPSGNLSRHSHQDRSRRDRGLWLGVHRPGARRHQRARVGRPSRAAARPTQLSPLARLEVPAALLARLSGDAFGRRLRAHLEGNGVDLSLAVAAAEPTTLAIVELDEACAATYRVRTWTARQTGSCPKMLSTDLPAPRPGCPHRLMALTRRPEARLSRPFLARARDHHTISIDPNVRPSLGVEPALAARHGRPLVRAGRRDQGEQRRCRSALPRHRPRGGLPPAGWHSGRLSSS